MRGPERPSRSGCPGWGSVDRAGPPARTRLREPCYVVKRPNAYAPVPREIITDYTLSCTSAQIALLILTPFHLIGWGHRISALQPQCRCQVLISPSPASASQEAEPRLGRSFVAPGPWLDYTNSTRPWPGLPGTGLEFARAGRRLWLLAPHEERGQRGIGMVDSFTLVPDPTLAVWPSVFRQACCDANRTTMIEPVSRPPSGTVAGNRNPSRREAGATPTPGRRERCQ